MTHFLLETAIIANNTGFDSFSCPETMKPCMLFFNGHKKITA